MKKEQLFTVLLLTMLAGTALTGCKHDLMGADAPELQGARPMEGENIGPGPTGPCDCGPGCKEFGVSRMLEIDPEVQNESFDFSVEVALTSDCPATSILPQEFGTHCTVSSRQRWVELDWVALNAANGKVEEFSEIKILKSDGSVLQDAKRDEDGTRVYVDSDATIYFRWADPGAHPDPTLAEVNSGGICIIGIMTEPYWPPRNWGGRWPSKLVRL